MKQFNEAELKILKENYRLTIASNPSPLSIKVIELTNEIQLSEYLLKVRERIEAANLMVAASLFVKRYSFAVLSALYSMSVWNKRLNFSLENVSLETLDEEDVFWLPSFKLHELSVEEAADGNRLPWRDSVLQHIFSNHVDVLFTHIIKVCKLTKLIMWENLYVYVCWMYEKLLNDTSLSHIHHQIQEDFQYILKTAPGHLFGSYHRNPFLRYDKANSKNKAEDQDTRVRQTCCFAYLTAMKGQHCKICPVSCRRRQAGEK